MHIHTLNTYQVQINKHVKLEATAEEVCNRSQLCIYAQDFKNSSFQQSFQRLVYEILSQYTESIEGF